MHQTLKSPIKYSENLDFIKKLKKQKTLLLAVLPAVLFVFIFQYRPMYGIIAAFQKFDIVKGYFGSEFVGIDNFKVLFQNTYHFRPPFWDVLLRTLNITFLQLTLGPITALIFALLLNELLHNKFKRTVQSISYLPHFLSWVIVSGMIYRFLDYEGPFNHLLGSLFGSQPVQFLAYSQSFIPILIIAGIWKELGYSAIIYISALSGIDKQLYEAGKIDGAGRFKLMWYVTLPGIMPTVIMLFILSMSRLMTVGFDPVWNLQNTLTRNETHVLDTFIYEMGIRQANYSIGIATGLFQGLIAMALVFLSNFISQKYTNVGMYKS